MEDLKNWIKKEQEPYTTADNINTEIIGHLQPFQLRLQPSLLHHLHMLYVLILYISDGALKFKVAAER